MLNDSLEKFNPTRLYEHEQKSPITWYTIKITNLQKEITNQKILRKNNKVLQT